MNKKIIIFFILCAMVCIFPAAGVSAAGADVIPNDNNGIPDRVLYQCILDSLKLESVIEKSRQEFTKQEAEKLRNLSFDPDNYKKNDYRRKKTVKTFQGISCLKNLRYLSINCYGIKQIKGMEPLPKLKHLDLSGNQLKEIKFIKNFKNLKYFTAKDNQITSLKGMEKLRNLTYVDIEYNRVKSLKELKNCTKMDRLYAGYNELKDLSGLAKMKDLKILSVYENRLASLKGIEGLSSLTTLFVSGNRLDSLRGVEALSKLRKLYVGENRLTSIEEAAGLKELRILRAGGNRLKSLPDLRPLRLTYFDCEYNFLEEGEVLAKLPQKYLNEKKDVLGIDLQLQNLDYSIELIEPSSVKQITRDTTRIVGHVNVKGARVRLLYDYNYEDGWIDGLYADADETGRFEFNNLDFKKYGGHLAYLGFGMYVKNTEGVIDDYYTDRLRFRIKK